jgi:hypothetical protein
MDLFQCNLDASYIGRSTHDKNCVLHRTQNLGPLGHNIDKRYDPGGIHSCHHVPSNQPDNLVEAKVCHCSLVVSHVEYHTTALEELLLAAT